MLIVWIVCIIVGFALLVKGADWFVDGAAGIAGKLRVSALVVGLTIVAFGTSMPELAVSVTSAIRHSNGISLGNVVGSNLSNILLILGVSALVRGLTVKRASFRLDLPVLVLSGVLLVVLGAWDGALDWKDGLVLVATFAVYMTVLFVSAKRHPEPPAPAPEGKKGKMAQLREKSWFLVLLTLLGLGMVVGGGTLLVDGAREIAAYFGVSERVVGLTVVAIGTSLPELVTSVVASVKGETDIAVGNVIGSNIFNVLVVAGVSSFAAPLAFPAESLTVDALVALAAALLLCFLAVAGRGKIGRPAGAVLLAGFIGYYVYLFLMPV